MPLPSHDPYLRCSWKTSEAVSGQLNAAALDVQLIHDDVVSATANPRLARRLPNAIRVNSALEQLFKVMDRDRECLGIHEVITLLFPLEQLCSVEGVDFSESRTYLEAIGKMLVGLIEDPQMGPALAPLAPRIYKLAQEIRTLVTREKTRRTMESQDQRVAAAARIQVIGVVKVIRVVKAGTPLPPDDRLRWN